MTLLNCAPGEKRFALGNEAIARGAIEAGIRLFSCYPGTPSSEVAEYLWNARQNEAPREAAPFAIEYSVNEKVAMEVACGAALAGSPSLVAMKHVGLNVAADPLLTAAYIGLPGGLVVLSADDPGCHSSQNEQDNRSYARFAHLPCFEPANAQEALDMTRAAFQVARQLEQPVLLRATTRVCHMRAPVIYGAPDTPPTLDFQRAPFRYVPVPAVALARHKALAGQMASAAEIAETSPFNIQTGSADARMGVIASGVARDYLRDALTLTGWTNEVATFELGMTWPLPKRAIEKFLRAHEKILILEEGAPLLENDIRVIAQKIGAACEISGKDGNLTEFGEYSTSLTLARLARWLNRAPISSEKLAPLPDLPKRPPNLCPGCAHRAAYYAVRRVFGDSAIYSSDIGCYTLGLLPPLRAADFLVCMGSSVSAGSGFARASGKTVIGFIGDSTFFHSGMTGLANAIFNNHNLLLIILDNGTTAMTGHQPNPGMIQEHLGDDATHLDLEAIVRSMGVKNFASVKTGNLAAMTAALEKFRDQPGVRVILAKEPCMLHARRSLKRPRKIVARVKRQGAETERCLRELACPAFTRENGAIKVNEDLCSGCMFCAQAAPGCFVAKRL